MQYTMKYQQNDKTYAIHNQKYQQTDKTHAIHNQVATKM